MLKSRFNSYWGNYDRLQKIILISLLVTSLLSFVVSLRDIKQCGGLDLRNKVVGARYLLAGLDPYAIEWSPPSERFLDPLRRYPGLSRITVTPLVLMVYCPFAWLPYEVQRLLWALMEWLAMILCILVLIKIVQRGTARFVFLVFALLFFASGFFWRLHVERGQFYVFLTLILSLAIFFDMRQKSIIAAILLGLLPVLRPTFLIILPLLLLLRRWKTAGIMALAGGAIFTVSLMGSNIQTWDSYLNNVVLIQKVLIDKGHRTSKYGVGNITTYSAEGVSFANCLSTPELPVSFSVALGQLAKKIYTLSPTSILQSNKIAGVCFIIFCFGIAFLIGRYSFTQRFVWIFVVAVVLGVDYFTPIRWQYTDVLFLPAIALIAPIVISPFVSLSFPTVITCAFLLGYDHTFTLFGFPIANIMRSFLFMIALNVFIISVVFQKIKRAWR